MYVFNLDQLKPFDILLIRFEGDHTSEQIQSICQSRHSHAVVYIGDGSFIEGVDPVVTLFSVHRYYFSNLDSIQVLRLKQKYFAGFDLVKAESSIRGLANCNYSTRLLYKIANRKLDAAVTERFLNTLNWTGGVVCTSLITLPYYVGGIDISDNKEPFYSHFGHIEGSPLFEDVTQTVLEEYTGTIPKDTFDYFALEPTGIKEPVKKPGADCIQFIALFSSINTKSQFSPFS